jgi:ubiquinone biosynthesis protein COQ4
MASPTSTRLQPIVALRALRALKRNREDTRQAVLVIDALRGKTSLRQFERFRRTKTGRAVLSERRQLLDRLCDRDRLAALPPGTLGRLYHEFMTSENLTAEGLVEASQIRQTLPADDDYTLFRERGRETHDLLHVVTGYGRDPLGEGCVTAFSFAQSGLKGFAVIAFWVAQRLSRRLRGQPVRRAVLEAYLHGRRAEWLYGADWEDLLAEPVATIRERYRIAPATYYPKVLAAVGARQAAKAQPAQLAA